MKFDQYYLKYGGVREGNLSSPRINPWKRLEWPYESVVHFLPIDDIAYGVDVNDPTVLAAGELPIFVEHVDALTTEQGAPKRLPFNLNKVIRDYHKRYRRLKFSRRRETTLRDPKTLLFVNYALLEHMYRYSRALTAEYDHWTNLYSTLWSTINTFKDVDRQHYITFLLPNVLPSLEALKRTAKKKTRSTLLDFNGFDELTILDVWCWLSKAESGSTLALLSDELLSRVNLVFIESGSWTMMNLGRVSEWLESSSPSDIALRWYKGLVKLFEKRTLVEETTEEEVEEEIVITKIDPSKARDVEVDLNSAIRAQAEELASVGLISGAEFTRALRLSEKYKSIKAPDGTTLDKYMELPSELMSEVSSGEIPDIKMVVDKSMLKSTLTDLNKNYVNKILPRQIAAMPMNAQRMGVAVTDFKVKEHQDAANDWVEYSVQLTPIKGAVNTVKFRLPKIKDDGSFIANGVRNRMVTQKADMPIRKVSSSRVSLTSYYGKVFINRSGKVVNDIGAWATRQLIAAGLNPKNEAIKDIGLGTNKISGVVPRLYSGIAKSISTFKTVDCDFYFVHGKREQHFGAELVKQVEREGHVVCGSKGSQVITMSPNGDFHLHTKNKVEFLGDLPAAVKMDFTKKPIELTEVKVFGKDIPTGVVLGYHLGIERLCKLLKVKYKTHQKGTRISLADNEYAIAFKDEYLIVSRDDALASLILGGFNSYKNAIRNYHINDFNSKEVYFNVLDHMGLTGRYLNEMDLLEAMFVDPITLDILKQMGEPTTWIGLLVRSSELLLTDEHLDEVDMEGMRFRGYERLAGVIYNEMVNGIRMYNTRPVKSNAKVEINPKATWNRVLQDPSVQLVEETNPIQMLRQLELVTYSGEGGRSGQTMVKRNRVYHPSNMGIISEATADSGNAGITTYFSADPKLANQYGVAGKRTEEDGNARMVSTAVLLTPGADRDDFKRANFISVQNGQGVACNGYQTQPIRTGYEQVMAHRADPMFAYAAPEDGVVKEITDKALIIEIGKGKEKETVNIEIGTIHGTFSGSHVPHNVVTDLKVGAKFKKGHVLSYHTGWFARDVFDPTQVSYKHGSMARVALMEGNDTFEDACAVSYDFSTKMSTPTTYIRSISVPFEDEVIDLINEGRYVKTDDVLCTLDSGFSDVSRMDTETVETLKAIAANAPKAKYRGTISKIEVFYRGNKEQMSKTLRAIVEKYDRKRAKDAKELNKSATTGELFDNIFFDKEPLVQGNAIIRVFIDKDLECGVGDKLVVANQLKTIISRVVTGKQLCEDGTPIDLYFSYKAVEARIVLSPLINGTTNTILRTIGRNAIDLYRNG